MATHSPIVAAQFKTEERFILELDQEKGVAEYLKLGRSYNFRPDDEIS